MKRRLIVSLFTFSLVDEWPFSPVVARTLLRLIGVIKVFATRRVDGAH